MSPIRTLLLTFVAPMLAAAALPCAAQLQLDLSRLDIPEPALLAPPQQTLQRDNALSLQEPGVPGFSAVSGASRASNWLGTAIQYEMPRATGDGQYTRPKVRVGLPSESLRGFLNSSGFSAEKCQLPLVRARVRTDGSDISGGTLWLYARCTFR